MDAKPGNTLKGVILGVCGSLLVALVLSLFSGIRHTILQDNQVSYNTTRIDKLEATTGTLKSQLDIVIAQHQMLMDEVKSNHSEEMALLRDQIRSEASNAKASAAEAALGTKSRSSLNVPGRNQY